MEVWPIIEICFCWDKIKRKIEVITTEEDQKKSFKDEFRMELTSCP